MNFFPKSKNLNYKKWIIMAPIYANTARVYVGLHADKDSYSSHGSMERHFRSRWSDFSTKNWYNPSCSWYWRCTKIISITHRKASWNISVLFKTLSDFTTIWTQWLYFVSCNPYSISIRKIYCLNPDSSRFGACEGDVANWVKKGITAYCQSRKPLSNRSRSIVRHKLWHISTVRFGACFN